MSGVDWRLPPSLLRWLSEIPAFSPVALLLRHSVRDYLPPGSVGDSLPITDEGVTLARELGASIGDRLCTLHTSPLCRCVQTAEALRVGAGVDISIIEDRLLGDPGIFVIDGRRAWSNWEERGHEGVMAHLVSQDFPLPGMADPEPAAIFLVQHMLVTAGEQPGLHIFITHDSLVTATAARLLGEPLGPDMWPWFLEGAFFWREDGLLITAYRDRSNRRSTEKQEKRKTGKTGKTGENGDRPRFPVLGNKIFKEEIAATVKRRVTRSKPGRPKNKR